MHSYSYSSASFTLCVARRLYYQWSCIQWVIFDSRSFAMLLRRQKPLTCTRENCKGQHRLLCNCMIMSLHCVARWWCDFDEFYIFYSRYLWAGLPFNRAEFLATFCIHITVIHRHRHNYCFWRVYGIDKLSKRRVGLIKSREVKGVTKDDFSAFVINQNWLCILINTLLFIKCPLIYMTVYTCWPKKNRKTKTKKKFRLPLKLSLLCGTRPKSARAINPTFGSHCSRFRRNQFTFGGVTAECVKTVFCLIDYFLIHDIGSSSLEKKRKGKKGESNRIK